MRSVAATLFISDRSPRGVSMTAGLFSKLDACMGQISLDVTDADVSALTGLLRTGVRVGNEYDERDLHLSEMIIKPWGCEYRAYADDFIDVWHLNIDPGHATSMHAHPRKVTYLICLAGMGTTHRLGGRVEVRPGSIVRIGKGVFHSTESTGVEPLTLIEVETPRNKFDLVRLRDGYQRAGVGYERQSEPMAAKPRKLRYMPNASMCSISPCGRYGFAICSGMDVHYRRHTAGDFLVPLCISGIVRGEIEILTSDSSDTRPPKLDTYYLSITQLPVPAATKEAANA
jgi:mannose-6-phosphate isomerase-like protein (cupin superfamily)